MSFDGGAAIGAGLIAGAVMSVLLYIGIAMMPRKMKMNLFLMLGTMMVGNNALASTTEATVVSNKLMAYAAGGMMHGVMSIVFGMIHVTFYTALGLESGLVAWGLLFGFAHWLISGLGLSMVPAMHPLMKRGQMEPPGVFALSYPPLTAMGFFILHLVFGIVVGALYGALAS